MDVYVVVEDGTVLGVGMTPADAEEIADRGGYTGAEAWRDWKLGTGFQRRTRVAPNGLFTYESTQEIVSAPLAGLAAAGQLSAALGEAVRREMAEQPITYDAATASPPATLRGEEFAAAMRRIADPQVLMRADDIRVGEGPAWEWLKAGLDKVATYPSDAPMPDSRAAAMIWGLPVIRDPNIPPNEIHVADVVYVVGPKDILGNTALLRFDFGETDQVRRMFAEAKLRKAIRAGRI